MKIKKKHPFIVGLVITLGMSLLWYLNLIGLSNNVRANIIDSTTPWLVRALLLMCGISLIAYSLSRDNPLSKLGMRLYQGWIWFLKQKRKLK